MQNLIQNINFNNEELPELITINVIKKIQNNQTPEGCRKVYNANYN